MVISMLKSFHGRTLATATATGQEIVASAPELAKRTFSKQLFSTIILQTWIAEGL